MSSSFEAPWIEKYRPTFLRDIVGNTEAGNVIILSC